MNAKLLALDSFEHGSRVADLKEKVKVGDYFLQETEFLSTNLFTITSIHSYGVTAMNESAGYSESFSWDQLLECGVCNHEIF